MNSALLTHQYIILDVYADQNQGNLRVLVVTAVTRSIPFEILDKGRSAAPNVTKVDSFATSPQ